MLTPEENALLTEVGPGTPCGALLRRYWQPVCYVGELTDAEPRKAVKVMGEELVVFRLPDGSYACLEEHCAHRCTSLAYGFVERDGLRCAYHGWKYDTTGQCVEQPFEPRGSSYKERTKLKSYPAQALGGLVFVYLGPTPAPLLPHWDFLVWTEGRRVLQRQEPLRCNWLQIQENTADVTHTYFLHGHTLYENGKRDRASLRLYRPFERFGFQPFEYGLIKAWEYAETEQWQRAFEVGNMLIFPNILRFGYSMHWRVPVDDTHTQVLSTRFDPSQPAASPEERERIEDHPPQYRPDGRHSVETIWAQDRMAWETQGAVMDRTKEHLGASDRGIILYRALLREQIECVQQGHDPLGIIRDPAQQLIELPLDQYVDAGSARPATTERTMFNYLDERQEWFEVPEGTARTPAYTQVP